MARLLGGLLVVLAIGLAGCADDPAPTGVGGDDPAPTAGGSAAPSCEEPAPADGNVIGWADVDGDGRDELWVRSGQAASAVLVGLYTFDERCEPERVTLDGAPFEAPVGGSVTTTEGLRCRAGDGAHLALLSAMSEDGRRYETLERTLRLDGAALVEVGTTTGETRPDDPDFARYGTFTCGDIVL